MKTTPSNRRKVRLDARREVEAYCQTLVAAGTARWWINDRGETELHFEGGEAYLFDELGITRLDEGTHDTRSGIGLLQ